MYNIPFFGSVLLVLTLACSNNQDTATQCYHEPALSYENFGKGYLDKHCVGCHSSLIPIESRVGAPIGVDLNTYQDVLLWVDRIDARSTGDNPTMPPGGGPSEEERLLLKEWLDCSVYPDAQEGAQ